MPSRYRALPFGPAEQADPKALLTAIIAAPTGAAAKPSPGPQWSEVVAHLAACGVNSLLVQEGVRDPDFLQEYEAFYSKQHRDISRHCQRVHAFRTSLPSGTPVSDEAGVLAFIDAASKTPDSYAGFVTVRPLRHAPVGATILADPPTRPARCKDVFPVHIAGRTFEVVGTPYLQQDNAVGACAQASIWMALRTIRRRLGNSAYSPAELTVSATRYWAQNRVFPGRQGLTLEQMLSAITASNHDPLAIQTAGSNPDRVIREALPYIESGLPVISCLKQPVSGGHALVAIGIDPGPAVNRLPPGLLIHNDNKGPYLLLPKKVPHLSPEYAIEQTALLIVPLPHGVFMSAAEAEPQATTHLGFWLTAFMQTPPATGTPVPITPLFLRTYLCTRHAFRRWATDCQDLDATARDVYRTTEMPKLVWVVEVHDSAQFDPAKLQQKTRLGEVVLDAAADALHGDSLIFMRLSKDMVTVATTSDGLLAIGGGATAIKLGTAARSAALAEAWD